MNITTNWSDIGHSLVAFVTTLGVIAVLGRSLYLLQRVLTDPLRRIPSPSWYRLMLLELRIWLYKWLFSGEVRLNYLHSKFGPIVRAGVRRVSIADPELIKQILQDRSLLTKESNGCQFSNSCFSMEELRNVFDDKMLLFIEPRMVAVIGRLFSRLDEHSTKDVTHQSRVTIKKREVISKLVSDIMATIILGLDFKKSTKYRYECVVNLIHERRRRKNISHSYPVLAWIPFAPFQTTYRACDEELKRKIQALLEDAESDQTQVGNIVGFCLERSKSTQVSNEQIAEDILAWMDNIEETLHICLTKAFETILNEPQTLRQIEEQITRVISDEDQEIDLTVPGTRRVTFEARCMHHLLTFKHLKSMEHFRSIVQKSMDCALPKDLLRYTRNTPYLLGKCQIPRYTEVRVPFKAIKSLVDFPFQVGPLEPMFLGLNETAHYTSQRLVDIIIQNTLASLVTRYQLKPHRNAMSYQNQYIKFCKRTRA